MNHKLTMSSPAIGRCDCGSTFQSYRSAKRHTEAQLTDDVLDQFNAHKASLRQQGRPVT